MQLRLTSMRWLERCTEIADVRVRIPECLKFFRLSFRNYVSKLRPWTAMIFFLRGSNKWYSYWYIHHFIFIFQFPDTGIFTNQFHDKLPFLLAQLVIRRGQSSNLGKPEFLPAFFSQLHMTMISCSLHLFLYSVVQVYEVHIHQKGNSLSNHRSIYRWFNVKKIMCNNFRPCNPPLSRWWKHYIKKLRAARIFFWQ